MKYHHQLGLQKFAVELSPLALLHQGTLPNRKMRISNLIENVLMLSFLAMQPQSQQQKITHLKAG